MTEQQKKLQKLLLHEPTLIELSKELSLSPKQTYQRILTLINKGYQIERKDYSDGNISFKLINKLITESNSKILYTSPNIDTIQFGIISDLHLGNSLQNLKALDIFYNDCINKNIHTNIIAGDIFQGLITSSKGTVLDLSYEEQFEKYLQKIPYNPTIINYCVLGNHDYSYLKNNHFDLIRAIKNKRYDIYPIGYKKVNLEIKNDKIQIHHHIDSYKIYEETSSEKLTIRGHSHNSKQKIYSNQHRAIYIPTLSNIGTTNEELIYPQFNTLTLNFNSYGEINTSSIETYIIIDKPIKLNETTISYNNTKNKSQIIKNEEEPKTLKRIQT